MVGRLFADGECFRWREGEGKKRLHNVAITCKLAPLYIDYRKV